MAINRVRSDTEKVQSQGDKILFLTADGKIVDREEKNAKPITVEGKKIFVDNKKTDLWQNKETGRIIFNIDSTQEGAFEKITDLSEAHRRQLEIDNITMKEELTKSREVSKARQEALKNAHIKNFNEDNPEDPEGSRLYHELKKNTEEIQGLLVQLEGGKDVNAELQEAKNKRSAMIREFYSRFNREKGLLDENSIKKIAPRYFPIHLRGVHSDEYRGIELGLKKISISRGLRYRSMRYIVRAMNKIGNDPKKGIAFVKGYTRLRPLRNTNIMMEGAWNSLMNMSGYNTDPQKLFHTFQSRARVMMDKIEGPGNSEHAKKVTEAIKRRLQYYYGAYCRSIGITEIKNLFPKNS